jgi:DNA primase
MSVGGAISPHQRELLEQAIAKMPAGATVVLGFDNDKAGKDLATMVEQLGAKSHCKLVREVPLKGKDWNELLKVKERDFIRSLGAAARPPIALGCER